jgi:hypothetical protein
MRRLLIALVLLAPFAACAEDIVILPTRSGVTQSYLLSAPEKGKARAVAILFSGGDGKVNLEFESARRKFESGNFLARARPLFAGNGIVAAVVDVPSDQSQGMEDAFRLGAAHAEDIGRVIADLKKRFPSLPVFLIGTSRGTVSAASVGSRAGKAVDGVVLTSTLFLSPKRQPILEGFDFSSIPSPVLFVHHVEDGCTSTPYSMAKRRADRYPLISVSGGLPATGGRCEGMSPHGYYGKEAETVNAIAKWMLKEPHPREIN